MIARRIIVITVMIVLAGPWSVDISAYQPLSSPASVTSQGTVPFTPQAFLDDFSTDASVNKWGCVTGAFGSTLTATTNPGYCTKTWYGFEQALKLDYDVRNSASFAGYYSLMGGGSVAGYTAISFRVRGAAGGEFFKIELKNMSTTSYTSNEKGTTYYRNKSAAYITDFLNGGVTTGWQKVTIPLENFENLNGVSSMKQFAIVFEGDQLYINGSQRSGTIYIDDIKFETAADFPINVIRVDHFGDKLFIGGLGGNVGSSGGDGGTSAVYLLSDLVEYHNYSCGMRFDFTLPNSTSYAYVWNIFGGGNADSDLPAVTKPNEMGNIPVPHNFSGLKYLSFWAKADFVAPNPRGFKVELKDAGGTHFCVVDKDGQWALSTVWKLYTFDVVRDFLDWDGLHIDPTTISQITFTVERGNSSVSSGTIHIDEVQFQK